MGFSLVVVCGLSLSSCDAQGPECMGSVVCGTWALLLRHASSIVVVHRLSCPAACGILVPWTGIEPTSPALEGKFFTTGPPGKSQVLGFWHIKSFSISWQFYTLNISPISTPLLSKTQLNSKWSHLWPSCNQTPCTYNYFSLINNGFLKRVILNKQRDK